MHVVGLTGGIACGKSTVARLLRERGLAVIDADRIARDLVEPGQPALADVLSQLGADLIGADGRLDRRALGRRVFADADARRRLEAILHPAIARASQEAFAALAREGHALAFYEAALLVETGRHTGFSALMVVSAPPALQRQRLVAREPDLGPEDVEARIAAQIPVDDKAALADVVIMNDGSLAVLSRRVDEAVEVLRRKLGG